MAQRFTGVRYGQASLFQRFHCDDGRVFAAPSSNEGQHARVALTFSEPGMTATPAVSEQVTALNSECGACQPPLTRYLPTDPAWGKVGPAPPLRFIVTTVAHPGTAHRADERRRMGDDPPGAALTKEPAEI